MHVLIKSTSRNTPWLNGKSTFGTFDKIQVFIAENKRKGNIEEKRKGEGRKLQEKEKYGRGRRGKKGKNT